MIILVDTDVLVDVALDREPFSRDSCALLDRLERRPGAGFVAWHSLSNFYSLVASGTGKTTARAFLVDLLRFVHVAPTTTASFMTAAVLEMTDLEDAMQIAAAVVATADAIATRNLADFARSPVPAFSPAHVPGRLR